MDIEIIEESPISSGPALRPWQYGAALTLGILFGGFLYKSEVIRWERINKMFRFEEPHMYIVIGMAIAIGIPSMWLIKRFEMKTVTGEEIPIKDPPFQKGVIYGGLIFGVGWAIGVGRWGAIVGPLLAGWMIATGLERWTYFLVLAALPAVLAALMVGGIRLADAETTASSGT